MLIDAAGSVTQANPAARRLFGLEEAGLPIGSVRALVAPSEQAASRVAFEELLRRGEAEGSLLLARRDGTNFWAKIQAARVDPETWLAFVADIGLAKAIEQALQESEERYRALVQASPIAILLVQEGKYTYANPAASNLFGCGEGGLVGESLLDTVHPDSKAMAKERLQRLEEGRPNSPRELRLLRRDGSTFIAESTSVPIVLNGKPAGLVFGRDVTERHRLEEQLRQAQKMEAVGQLAGGVAHDFNNTLTGIMMNTYLLKKNPVIQADAKAQIAEVEQAAKRAANLTRQLLLFSRRQTMEFREVDLNHVAENLLRMLRRLLGEHIALTLDPNPRPIVVEADPGMMEQVIMNLCVNARDAMPQGGQLTLRIRDLEVDATANCRHPDARRGLFACLAVSDTGCGMDDATLSRIFEPFFTTKDAGKGTGLGLSTVYGIVKQHQGWVEVRSAPGRGSCFEVYLPLKAKDPSAPADVAEILPEIGGRETILLVEDEAVVRHTLSSFLRQSGYEVFEAVSATSALAAWEQQSASIGLLFTDVVLPDGLSGLDLVERFTKEKPSLKVIVGSGYSEEVNRHGVPSRPGMVFLPKPYEPATLIGAIRRCLDEG